MPTPEENYKYSANHPWYNTSSKPIHFYQSTYYTPLVISGNDKNKKQTLLNNANSHLQEEIF
jgi:hypothetical protein